MLSKLKQIWDSENINTTSFVSNHDIVLFESKNKSLLPLDLVEYFKILDGTEENYDENFFQFYSLNNFQKVSDFYKDWKGEPNYDNLKNTLPDFNSYYVFADYSFNLFSYAIRLDSQASKNNEILIICGDKYQVIANSFSAFLSLYLNKSMKLQFED